MKNTFLVLAAVLVAGAFGMPEGFTDDFDAALRKAGKENKTVFALFTGSDWCIWCKRLEGEVLSRKPFPTEVVKDFVPVFLDFPRDKSLVAEKTLMRNRELAEKYDIQGYPTVLLLDAKGEVVGRTGYQAGGPEKYLRHLRALPARGGLEAKWVEPHTKRLSALMKAFMKDVTHVAAQEPQDDQRKAYAAGMKKHAGTCLKKVTALRDEVKAQKTPEELKEDIDALLEKLDQLIENLKKAEKGAL